MSVESFSFNEFYSVFRLPERLSANMYKGTRSKEEERPMKLPAVCFFFVVISSLGFGASPQKVTVPLVIESHRIFLDAQFTRKDGSLRTARLWVDTGTPDFQISKALAEDLGLDLSAPAIKSEDGIPQVQVQIPGLRIGSLPLDLQSAKPMVIVGPQQVFAGSRTEGNLPATILMHYQLVLDIAHHRLTLSEPGGLKPKGPRLPCLIQPKTGMVQLDATIAGRRYSLALDSGAPYSMVSTGVIEEWSTEHKEWEKITGAAGAANLFGIPGLLREPEMRIPLINPAGVPLNNVGVLGMDPDFVTWYSKKTAAPVIGFLAWNVLQAYRVTIDYFSSNLYFEKQGEIDFHDTDAVGLTLAQSRSGGYAVWAVVQKDGKPTVDGAQPGDKLLKVDDLDVTRVDLQTAVDALHGKPGEFHTLVLDRKGVSLTIKAKVMRLI
jgi:hypothetical protein